MTDQSIFTAKSPGEGPYVDRVLAFLSSHGIASFDQLCDVPQLPPARSGAILRHLLELACQAQAIGNIIVGRYCIQRLPRPWVLGQIEACAEDLLATDDEWEYRRLLELYSTIDAELTARLASHAQKHQDPEIRDAGREFSGVH